MSLNGTRRLAVDDEEDVVKNIRQTMAGTGVSADCALNGQAAVRLVARAAQEAGMDARAAGGFFVPAHTPFQDIVSQAADLFPMIQK